MYKEKTFLAVIPARGGSKGIPRKNIFTVNNKPLIQYTIDEALSSRYLDEVIVSTDDLEIAKISRDLGAGVPYLRPAELANDQSKTIDAIIHIIEEQKKRGKVYDYVVVLQPTQPLRKFWHIDEAIQKIINSHQSSLVSISLVKEHPILFRTLNEDGLVNNLLNVNSTVRRQEFNAYYKVNGAIYINKIDANFNHHTSLNDNKLGYIMDTKFDLDIDTYSDLERFKLIQKGIIN
ncbi:acylneuraminate cytidylyltransferase family protein [Bacillus xiapuensis]|uniref:acylneuraminate cytidylyltransferase family protein n=1 Tax=Bacillus xiapuensis TaxID=2014075 RepID=UPI000C23543A|nr:acylneuraminate cytidylyltransferase family protein [Bacillus xiapuensis]